MESAAQVSRIESLSNNTKNDLICFSHLRWDFVFQRPQHLLKRAAGDRRVFFFEEPILDDGPTRLDISESEGGVLVVVPHLPKGVGSQAAVLRDLVRHMIDSHKIEDYVVWYDTPMALSFTNDLNPKAVIYDCMDQLSAFESTSQSLRHLEEDLFQKADVVFTEGRGLYSTQHSQHDSLHCFPCSIDRDHFMSARTIQGEPSDQKNIPHPRLGFFGVIDERFAVELLDAIAEARPEWQFILLGPVVKVDLETLPKHNNIHYLGSKSYQDLPRYLAGWDVALLLLANNEATKFIGPAKTLEYLAAGKPVVSTPIIRPYGEMHLVEIAKGPGEFIVAIERVLNQQVRSEWLNRVDDFLSRLTSWDDTWQQMSDLIDQAIQKKSAAVQARVQTLTTHAESAGI